MNLKLLILLLLGITFFQSCNENKTSGVITNTQDYETYLLAKSDRTLDEAWAQKDFWSNRLRPDSSGVGDLMPLAASYEQLFEATGNVTFLYNAEKLYKKGQTFSANDKDVFARGLAHNYITQHRFQESYQLLEDTYKGVSNKHQTQLMLFDAAMEVGEYDQAYKYLNAIKDLNDYSYLIRLSKWSDHRGDLDSAIKFMEDAKKLAEAKESISLKIWTYSNLGDYYGHAGRIADSYEYYLKTLELQPTNAHAKKGIAWIAYSSEKNTEEAHRIIKELMKHQELPDYHLMEQELYQFEGNTSEAEAAERKFVQAIENGNYGAMYNAYLIPIYAESNPSKALELAQIEVQRRATPETHHLLALALVKNNKSKEALAVINDKVIGKTYEPTAMYHTALVYQANGMTNEMKPIKEELLEASYELGPLLIREIEQW